MSNDPIAIIGTGCRFPGGVNNSEAFWKLLVEEREVVGDIPADRWNIQRYFDAEAGLPGKSITHRGGFLDGIDQFDPQFFGISPREAPYIDPQQRLLLETAWEAMEEAGIVLDLQHGTDIGVFVGISHNDYQGIQGTPSDHAGVTSHSPTGSAHSIAANRISYCFNLSGPSVAMDTACSSALTAIHTACEHIRSGRGDMALAGGVTVIISPGGFIGFSQAGMLSPEGRCAAFDASASGFVRGEGAGMVMLKRLSKAIADGDLIQGVIVGTALNQDGHTNGIMLPSSHAQARLVADVCREAGVDPSAIGYVEAHGTGTAVGDPLEAHALSTALCRDRPADAPLVIGSVKTNLGHLETAAGVAGLMKAMLVLRYGQIPASLHFKEANPHIDFAGWKLRVATRMEPFPTAMGPRMAGVNSFGFGGSNAHALLTEPPPLPHPEHPAASERGPWPLVLSARSEDALRSAASRLGVWLEEHSHLNGSSPMLPDLTYTLGARRNHHPFRFTLVPESMPEAIRELNAFGAGNAEATARTAFAPRLEGAPRVAFVMSGQGPQWWGMGRELMRDEPVFRQTMERCDAAMRAVGFNLLEELAKTEDASQIGRTGVAQPAIFAMQVSLAELWKSWGMQPSAVVGHSVGEIAAACAAGIFSLEEGARIIVLRARFMDDCARGEGTMLAVGLDEEAARALIVRHDRTVKIAAFNGPRSLTLAGSRLSLEAMQAELEPQGVFARLVKVDHPFHHPLMEPAAAALEKALADLVAQAETVPFFSTVTGGRCEGENCTARHWGNGVRQAVLFAPAVGALADFGVDVWLELGAHPALVHSVQECLAARGAKATVVASTRRDREHKALLETAMDLHRAGVGLDFASMTPSRRLLTLPAYPWDKRRWWSEASEWRESRVGPAARGLLQPRQGRATPTWSVHLDARHMAFLKDHVVESMTIFPAAGFVEMALEAGVQWFEGRSFAIEDFEIRKPLILPDPVSGVHLEISYDPAERTFVIQSKFEQGSTWSVHVVGAMRSERTESTFAASKWEGMQADGGEPKKLDGFYQHMTDHGLRYGEEFRPIRELFAGDGKSAGRVSLSETVAKRAGDYSLHPVLFDGAMQVLSAGAKTVEDRKSGMKLPVRFSRILFLRSPGAACLVRAAVTGHSDQFMEGRIGVYDEAGAPCVLVDGFRAISVAGARRGGNTGNRNVLYHPTWEQAAVTSAQAAVVPVPLARLHQAAADVIGQVLDVRGRANLQKAGTDAETLAAAHLANGLREMARFSNAGSLFNAETLQVAEGMRASFERITGHHLVKCGLLEKAAAGYRPTPAFDREADAAPELLRTYIGQHAGHLAEALLCAANCAELGAIFRGEKEAVQVLFARTGADLLDQFYGEGLYTSHWLAGIAGAVRAAAEGLPEGRGLRILEVGAGTGGLAAQVLPSLGRGVHAYTFSDVSAGFFSAAAQKLASYPEVEFKMLNLEKPGIEQGFEAGSFDLIIGTNVIHATSDVRAALRNIHTLLAPGGSLVFMDVANPQLWTDSVFGLTAGWWRFTDRDLRTQHPLLGRAQWEAVMQEAGFAETASIPGLPGSEGEGQIGLFARKVLQEGVSAEDTTGKSVETSWLVLADGTSAANPLIARLRAEGVRCRVARRAKEFAATSEGEFQLRPEAPEDWTRLVQACSADSPLERVVYFWGLDEPADGLADGAALMGVDALFHLGQALGTVKPPTLVRLDLITRGAQPAGQSVHAVAAEQAPLVGLLRVIGNEFPHVKVRSIDLPPTASAADAPRLWEELLRTDKEGEVALRGEARYVQRVLRGPAAKEVPLAADVPRRLESRERGHLDTLRFVPFARPAPGAGAVLIRVKAAGMNFRDVLKALALYPGEAPDAKVFGDEVAGIVEAVGAGVTHVGPGDWVFGLAMFGLSSLSLARGGDVRRIPGNLTFEEAATLPVVFMTSWHALQNVARMRRGETILVHAGAGGVGMAAIQIARHLGVEVIASAGNATKRRLLETLGVKHVIDSRRGDFAEAVMELTGGRGVDAILNALAAEAIPMGLSCLAQFGRFLEIGKRDIYQNTRIPLWPLRKNASFHVIAMDAVFAGDESLTRDMLAEICELVEAGALGPLPYRSFPASKVDAAFRLMAGGKHIGKVLVAFPEPFLPPRGEPLAPGFNIRPDGTYLITGAFGGYGKVVADWLVEGGARHLALTGRRGAATPEAQELVRDLRARGATVQVIAADVGSPDDVARMMAEIAASGQGLRGVFHLAMVIDDALMTSLDRERMRAVMAPKSYGAWLLHHATRDVKLDCFAMFSSVSSIFGNPAQANYGAANAFLDALAHHRRTLGLPATTINWGVLGGEGYVARNTKVAEFLAKQGTTEITPSEVTSLLESAMAAGTAQTMAIRVDWGKWRQFFRGVADNPLLERIFATVETQEAKGGTTDLRAKIESAGPGELEALVLQGVRGAVGGVLRVKPDTLRDDQPLTDLGLDSLMGVEIENSIESSLGVSLPPASLLRARTIGHIVTLIVEHIGAKRGGGAPATGAPVPVAAASAEELNLDVLSDAEIDSLLGEAVSGDEPTDPAEVRL